MSDFVFPKPGEHANVPAVLVELPDLRSLLIMAARGIDGYYFLYGATAVYDDAVDRWCRTQAEALGETEELLTVLGALGIAWPGSRG